MVHHIRNLLVKFLQLLIRPVAVVNFFSRLFSSSLLAFRFPLQQGAVPIRHEVLTRDIWSVVIHVQDFFFATSSLWSRLRRPHHLLFPVRGNPLGSEVGTSGQTLIRVWPGCRFLFLCSSSVAGFHRTLTFVLKNWVVCVRLILVGWRRDTGRPSAASPEYPLLTLLEVALLCLGYCKGGILLGLGQSLVPCRVPHSPLMRLGFPD